MAADHQLAVSRGPVPALRRIATGGTSGNELLTAASSLVLLVLLAILGVTIVAIGPLLSVHLFVGMLLIGPLGLKMASTGYRFVRYYTHAESYRRKGPPPTPLRLLAPVVVISTVVVFATGVALLFVGPQSRDTLLPIHKVSFFVWLAFTGLHILAHIPSLPRTLRTDFGAAASGQAVAGRDGRRLAIIGALLGGVVLAIVAIPQFAPWLSAHFHHH